MKKHHGFHFDFDDLFDDFGFGLGNIDNIFGEDNGVHEFGNSFFSERKLNYTKMNDWVENFILF
jgi:hypothetical protein